MTKMDLKDLDEEKMFEELKKILPFGKASKEFPNLYRLYLRLSLKVKPPVTPLVKPPGEKPLR